MKEKVQCSLKVTQNWGISWELRATAPIEINYQIASQNVLQQAD